MIEIIAMIIIKLEDASDSAPETASLMMSQERVAQALSSSD